MSLLCCDQHGKWSKGCAGCNDKARLYTKGRRLAALNGRAYSGPVEVCRDWLRELRALGYSKRRLAVEVGVGEKTVYQLTAGQRNFVTLGTFHRVEAAYVRLRNYAPLQVDPRVYRFAADHGWAAPEPLPAPATVNETDVDEQAVERALLGERVPLTRAEMTAAWQELETRGVTAAEIARLLHVAERTVQRWRCEGAATSRRHKAPRAS